MAELIDKGYDKVTMLAVAKRARASHLTTAVRLAVLTGSCTGLLAQRAADAVDRFLL